MAPKRNPLKLNKLQLKTLTLLQELAQLPDMATPNAATGEVTITGFPPPHGNHFHMGRFVVMASDDDSNGIDSGGNSGRRNALFPSAEKQEG